MIQYFRDPENTGSISVLTDAVKPFLPRAVMDMLDRQILEAQEECVPGIAKQKTSIESCRVEKGRKRSKTLLGFAAERGEPD